MTDKSASYNRKLLYGFGASLLLLFVSSIASYVSIQKLKTATGWVSHTDMVLRLIESATASILDAESGERGYLLTGQPAFLDHYNGSYGRTMTTIGQIKRVTADNDSQQIVVVQFKDIVQKRMALLQQQIVKMQNGQTVMVADLVRGNEYMSEVRRLAMKMKSTEQQLLLQRTSTADKYSNNTPLLIISTALVSLLITIVFYLRVRRDFHSRVALNRQLQEKDVETSRRISLIQSLATKIAGGEYAIRIDEQTRDQLGELAEDLNRMAASLETSFGELARREWLQSAMAGLNECMLGEQEVKALCSSVLSALTANTGSQYGACYTLEEGELLQLQAAYGWNASSGRQQLLIGEGLAGQAAADKKILTLSGVAEERYTTAIGPAQLRPAFVIAMPVVYEGHLIAVVELAGVQTLSNDQRTFLHEAENVIGLSILGAQNRAHLQDLLEETQRQGEELLSQHEELQSTNEALNMQTQRLQASEEELRVQQEELQEANQEMEERASLLEEKNQEIAIRNEAIQQKAQELEDANRYKSEFLANMSHELRTPLNSILLLSRLLGDNAEGNLSPEQTEYAQVIQKSGAGLLTLIDEILDLSKIEAGRMMLDWTRVSLAELGVELKQMFAPVAAGKRLDLDVSVGQEVPPAVTTDRLRLEQVLRNLLSNAIKFTKEGSVKLAVTMPEKGYVRFAVTDTGIGIAPEQQHYIFEAFRQADGSTQRQFGGTGLGLSISRQLTSLLQGELTVESEAGKGSTFSFTIPVDRVTEQPLAQLAAPKVSQPQPPRQKAAFVASAVADDRNALEISDKVILIVEDDQNFAKALLDTTRRNGFKVIVATRGEEGIRLAAAYHPHAILLDIMLPEMDGWAVLDALKGNASTRNIPVHMMSAVTQAQEESLNKGAVDFISKPAIADDMQHVFERINSMLGKDSDKVLIAEEHTQHAKALALFLEQHRIKSRICDDTQAAIEALQEDSVRCVILNMNAKETADLQELQLIKQQPGLEYLPIIIFTGRSLSAGEVKHIRLFADSIVMKTAHSYRRILDEVALFLHLVAEEKAGPQAGGATLNGKTILIADDDARNIYSLTKNLEQQGMKVISALDGEEALEILKTTAPDAVLMDIMMPRLDGLEATRRIRADKRFKNLPVIAVTAKAMSGDREQCIAAGANDYISKPLDMDQLLSLLRVWLYTGA